MLRLYLTVYVLFGHQVAGQEALEEVIDFCEDNDCPEPIENILFNNYEEMEFLPIQWIETEVNGMDMKSALTTGLDKLLNYSWFANAADTIVPVTAPWGLQGYLVNGTIQQKFTVFLLLAQITSPPEPTDQTVKLGMRHTGWSYIRFFNNKVDDQQNERRVIEFLKDLEEGKQSFEKSSFYIAFYNTDGLIAIVFKA